MEEIKESVIFNATSMETGTSKLKIYLKTFSKKDISFIEEVMKEKEYVIERQKIFELKMEKELEIISENTIDTGNIIQDYLFENMISKEEEQNSETSIEDKFNLFVLNEDSIWN